MTPPPQEPAAHPSSDSDGDEKKPVKPSGRGPLEYDRSAEVVEVSNVRLFNLYEMELNALKKCSSLILRKNLIHELRPPLPDHLAARLEELDLFDNKIRKIGSFFHSCLTFAEGEAEEDKKDDEGKEEDEDALPRGAILREVPNAFPCIVKLDLSYNQIKRISGLDCLGGTLKELYLVENRIKTISGLEALVNLELLELGGNQIREIGSSLETLVNLKQLWIGKNKIRSLGTSLHNLHQLELLSLQANRLTEIAPENFPDGFHPLLKEVFFSENGIEVMENLPLHAAKLIDFSFNPMSTLSEAVLNVENVPELEEFWITDARVKDWSEVSKLACFATTLRTVYLERNPIEEDRRYRDKVYQELPFLYQIDSWPITNKGNLEADRSIQRRG